MKRNIVEEAVAALRKQRDMIEKHLPCKITLHLPPPDGRDQVVIEALLKLRDDN